MNATEAKNLSKQNDPRAGVEIILDQIRASALLGKYELKTYSCGFGEGKLYCDEKNFPEHNKAILGELRKLGYVAEVRVEERQFVDIYLHVSWTHG